MRSRLGLVAAVCVGLGASAEVARADGGTVRASTRGGGYLVTVFTSPTPWRVGLVEVNVLVQDAATKEAIANAEVLVRMWAPGQEGKVTHHSAGGDDLKTARFEVSAAGRWHGEAIVSGPSGQVAVPFEVDAAEAVPPWLSLLPWIAWPLAGVLLFAVHQVLVRRSSSRR